MQVHSLVGAGFLLKREREARELSETCQNFGRVRIPGSSIGFTATEVLRPSKKFIVIRIDID